MYIAHGTIIIRSIGINDKLGISSNESVNFINIQNSSGRWYGPFSQSTIGLVFGWRFVTSQCTVMIQKLVSHLVAVKLRTKIYVPL